MAGVQHVFYRNYNSTDTTNTLISVGTSSPWPSPPWDAPSGYVFKEWNSARDGSGYSANAGDPFSPFPTGSGETAFAIWEPMPTPYKVTDAQLNSIADAINTKAGTTGQLQFPDGFVSAIEAIPTGGGGGDLDEFLATDFTSAYENSTATIIGIGKFAYQFNLKTVNFPSCLNIGNYAFYSCKSLNTISFPVCSYIGDYAFYMCERLTTANFPSCKTIASRAFYSCSKLTTAVFPICTTIWSSAFYSCPSLATISFPECTNIRDGAFYSCPSLTTANFPKCTSISGSAFYSCKNLTTINFPLCTRIEGWAFYRCIKITEANFSNCTSIGSYAFLSCSSLESVSLPLCANAGYGAFANCINLSTISLPVCTNIGSSMFRECYNFLSLYLTGSSVATLANSNAFSSTPIAGYTTSTGGVYGSIYVPSSLLASYQTATNWTYFSSRFVGI